MDLRKLNKVVSLVALLVASFTPASGQKPGKSLTPSQIKEAESRLSQLGYWTGPIDGRFDVATQAALVAFQKWSSRPITGKLTLDEIEAIRASTAPTPRDGDYEHVEIDVDRQVLLIVGAKGDVKVLPVSTGSGKPFIDDNQESVAYTPRGRFVVYDKIDGWEHGPIGRMYYPNYISGGVAIHGSLSVPAQPETHGCIRIPMFAAREVSRQLSRGTIVLVYDNVSFVSAKAWAENPKLKQSASIE
jgi:N-acetylmuramoyl-L-alanine amidase